MMPEQSCGLITADYKTGCLMHVLSLIGDHTTALTGGGGWLTNVWGTPAGAKNIESILLVGVSQSVLLNFAECAVKTPQGRMTYNNAKVAAVNCVNSDFGIFTTVLPPPCIFIPPPIGTQEAYCANLSNVMNHQFTNCLFTVSLISLTKNKECKLPFFAA